VDYRTYLAPAISFRDEEGISSCVTYPCHHAVATTPPAVSFPVSVKFRRDMLPSLYGY
jgi:hypothetical protein